MCGIVGIYNKNGLTIEDVDKFTEMLEKARSRGIDATGVISQDMRALKAPVSSEKFIKTEKYKNFKNRIIGQKFVIGHCRQATRGSPENNANNHPITLIEGEERISIVHNGKVECAKWDDDAFKNDKNKQKTDTYVFLNAIKSYYEKPNANQMKFDAIVRLAFEDVYRSSTHDSSVIVVFTKEEIVFCKTYGKPMSFCFFDEDSRIWFASEPEILKPEVTKIGEMKVCKWSDMEDHVIVSIDVNNGVKNADFLSSFIPPVPIRDRFERVYDQKEIQKHYNVALNKAKTASLDKWTSGKVSFTADRSETLDPVFSDEEESKQEEGCRKTCFECFSAINDSEDVANPLKNGFYVFCAYFNAEIDAGYASSCDVFQKRPPYRPDRD